MSKHTPSKLAVRLAAQKIFVEIIPESARRNPRDLWWQRASTREPLEQSIDKILAEEFNAKFNHLRELLKPCIESCFYCHGSGRVERAGPNNTVEGADCYGCFYYRETLRLLPPEYHND